MKNKKLLKFLLKDLIELEELLTEKEDNSFDELEMEFMQTRVSGAKRMIQILFDNENSAANEKDDSIEIQKEMIGKPKEKTIVVEKTTENKIEEKIKEAEIEIIEEAEDANNSTKEKIDEAVDLNNTELKKEQKTTQTVIEETDVELEEEMNTAEANNRLGDSFSKEKSVNDLAENEKINLEHKISNRPVEKIKTAIGINDKFQFIRELFDGDAEIFTNTVSELDAKTNINEAVKYLQQNFKWKKNETSLKFVTLVKRRFSNE